MKMRRYNKHNKRLRKKYVYSVSAMIYYNEVGRSLRGKAEYYISDGIQMGTIKYDNVELEFFDDVVNANERGVLCFRDKNNNFTQNSFTRDEFGSMNEFYRFIKAIGVFMGFRENRN